MLVFKDAYGQWCETATGAILDPQPRTSTRYKVSFPIQPGMIVEQDTPSLTLFPGDPCNIDAKLIGVAVRNFAIGEKITASIGDHGPIDWRDANGNTAIVSRCGPGVMQVVASEELRPLTSNARYEFTAVDGGKRAIGGRVYDQKDFDDMFATPAIEPSPLSAREMDYAEQRRLMLDSVLKGSGLSAALFGTHELGQAIADAQRQAFFRGAFPKMALALGGEPVMRSPDEATGGFVVPATKMQTVPPSDAEFPFTLNFKTLQAIWDKGLLANESARLDPECDTPAIVRREE